MSLIGQSPPRPDGLAKVTGTARYADDLIFPDLLYGATLRSPHPHARIEKIVLPESAPDGSVFVTASGLPGPNAVRLIDDDWPILAAEETRHVGEAIVLVAAPSRLAARRARNLIAIDYTELPAVLDLAAADQLEPLCTLEFGSAKVEAALEEAAHVIQGTYRTGHQEHIYIECQGMTAWFDQDGGLTVIGTMQCPYYVHKSLMHAFDLPSERVRVQASVVGGGFGGKEDFPSMIAIHAALLARSSARPVRLVYDRHEDIIATTKRHPAVVTHRTGVDAEGRLLAMDIDVVMDGGAYATLSSVVLSRALLHAGGAYRCPEVRIRGRVLRTHTATNGAFRGFGAPQTLFAVERQMDRIARELGLDPLEIRLRNALEAGDRLPTGQILDETTSALTCLERVAELTDFKRRWHQLERQRDPAGEAASRSGLGLSLYFHGAGFTGNGERRMRSPVRARLTPEGRIEVLTAMTDMGQGCVAIFPQMACEATGLRPQDFEFASPDTALVPDSGPTVASRTTMIVGGTLVEAVRRLRDLVLETWRRDRGVKAELTIAEGQVLGLAAGRPFDALAREVFAQHGALEVTHRHEPPADLTFDEETYQGSAYPTYGWGANVVEVEVDSDTLEVRPLRVNTVCEVGRAIHPILCRGQIEGGVLQAIAWGLMEEVKMDNGRYLNDRLATYIIPTFKDAPKLDVELVERPWKGGPFGAKGVGELPMDGGAPAALAAIENATGIRLSEIPATPERLLAATVGEEERP